MDEHSYEWTPWCCHSWQKHTRVPQKCTLYILYTLNVPNPFNPTIWSKLIDLKWTLSYKKLSKFSKKNCLNLGLLKGYHKNNLVVHCYTCYTSPFFA